MRLLIAGSRTLRLPRGAFKAVMRSLQGWGATYEDVACVLSGRCPLGGADELGEEWASLYRIPVEPYPPTGTGGPSRFHARNRRMAQACDAAVLLFAWDGGDPVRLLDPQAPVNRGTLSMRRELQRAEVERVAVWAIDERRQRMRLLNA